MPRGFQRQLHNSQRCYQHWNGCIQRLQESHRCHDPGQRYQHQHSLRINYAQSNYVEKENNNSFETATEIAENKAYEASINDAYDTDYYSFRLSSPGLINIDLSRPSIGKAEEYYVITLYGYDTSEICSFSFNGIDTSTNTYSVGLDKGAYYLLVTGGNFYYDYSHGNQFVTSTYMVIKIIENTELDPNQAERSQDYGY